MMTALNFTAFWTLQLKYNCNRLSELFPWPVTSSLLTVSSGPCGGWSALASAFMLTGGVATDLPWGVLFTATAPGPSTLSMPRTMFG